VGSLFFYSGVGDAMRRIPADERLREMDCVHSKFKKKESNSLSFFIGKNFSSFSFQILACYRKG